MLIFAQGFSERLNILATTHRPPSTVLTFDQISALSQQAGYQISKTNEVLFTILHPDAKHGLDRGFYLKWHVKPQPHALVYFPVLQPYYERGSDPRIIDEMLTRLASFLPNLGFRTEIVIPVEEEIIVLPDELKHYYTSGIEVMFVSEFQHKFQTLYDFMQGKMSANR